MGEASDLSPQLMDEEGGEEVDEGEMKESKESWIKQLKQILAVPC